MNGCVIGQLESAVREHPNGCGYQHGWQVKCLCGWKVMTFSSGRITDLGRTAIDHVCGVLVTEQTTGFLPRPVVLEASQKAAVAWTRARVGEDAYLDLISTIDPGDEE